MLCSVQLPHTLNWLNFSLDHSMHTHTLSPIIDWTEALPDQPHAWLLSPAPNPQEGWLQGQYQHELHPSATTAMGAKTTITNHTQPNPPTTHTCPPSPSHPSWCCNSRETCTTTGCTARLNFSGNNPQKSQDATSWLSMIKNKNGTHPAETSKGRPQSPAVVKHQDNPYSNHTWQTIQRHTPHGSAGNPRQSLSGHTAVAS